MIVAITGASGVVHGVRLLAALRDLPLETHLILSRSGALTLAYEMDIKVADVEALADVVHRPDDMGAPVSSGSFRTLGMIVAPCSIRTMSEIATGVTTTLVSRAADVVLKERRRLVLMVRETPLHAGHLRTMAALADLGAIIAPPVPAFYARPQTIDELVDHSVGRALDLFDIETEGFKRWGESPRRKARKAEES